MPHNTYDIKVRILGGLNSRQQAAFKTASAFWGRIISADVPSASVDGEVIDDLLVEAVGTRIDGVGRILGQAGPTHLRPGTMLPVKGHMEFDRDDLARMETDRSLDRVIMHEMGHVIGIGTLWRPKNLLAARGSANPTFTGAKTQREYARLAGGIARPVPVENTGGPGTREGHWRDRIFGNELMTGFISPGANPISRVTLASLEDLGYRVNYAAAEQYLLPGHLELAEMGVFADGGAFQCGACGRHRTGVPPIVIPESDLIPKEKKPKRAK
jgi:Leishmanolysin